MDQIYLVRFCVFAVTELITCNILFDLMNLAYGVVPSEHIQVKRLRVFPNTRPHADVWSGPSSGEEEETNRST